MTRCAHCWAETCRYFFCEISEVYLSKIIRSGKDIMWIYMMEQNHFSFRCIDGTVQVTMEWFPPKCSERSTEWRFRCWLNVFVNSINLIIQQVFSSSWNGRPFGHKRHGLKSRGILCLFFWAGADGRKPKQLQGTSTDVKWPVIASVLITLQGTRWV